MSYKKILMSWMGFNLLGMYGGLWVGTFALLTIGEIVAGITNIDYEKTFSTSIDVVHFSTLGLFYAAVLGAMQWQLLQRLQLKQTWKRWVVPSAFGGLLAGIAVITIPELLKLSEIPGPLEGLVYGVLWGTAVGFVSGACLSVPQLYYLRPVLRKTLLWVLANIIAWSAVFILLAGGPDDEGWSIFLMLPAAILVSLITGLALLLLLWLNRDALAENNPEKGQ